MSDVIILVKETSTAREETLIPLSKVRAIVTTTQRATNKKTIVLSIEGQATETITEPEDVELVLKAMKKNFKEVYVGEEFAAARKEAYEDKRKNALKNIAIAHKKAEELRKAELAEAAQLKEDQEKAKKAIDEKIAQSKAEREAKKAQEEAAELVEQDKELQEAKAKAVAAAQENREKLEAAKKKTSRVATNGAKKKTKKVATKA